MVRPWFASVTVLASADATSCSGDGRGVFCGFGVVGLWGIYVGFLMVEVLEERAEWWWWWWYGVLVVVWSCGWSWKNGLGGGGLGIRRGRASLSAME